MIAITRIQLNSPADSSCLFVFLNQSLLLPINLSTTDHFGSFQLSSDGRCLLYIAEKNKPHRCSFFKRQDHKTNDLEGTLKHVPVSTHNMLGDSAHNYSQAYHELIINCD